MTVAEVRLDGNPQMLPDYLLNTTLQRMRKVVWTFLFEMDQVFDDLILEIRSCTCKEDIPHRVARAQDVDTIKISFGQPDERFGHERGSGRFLWAGWQKVDRLPVLPGPGLFEGLGTFANEEDKFVRARKFFLQKLSKRGLAGVEHVTSDRDSGLKQAIRQQLPGVIWTPCHAHLRRNVLDETPEEWWDSMKDLMDEVLKASSQPEAWEVFEEILDGKRQKMVTVTGEDGQTEEVDAYRKLREEAVSALAILKENLEDATAVLALPGKYRRRLHTTNMIERLIEEVRRREKVIRIFPNMESAWRLIGAVLAEKHEEWSTGRKYLDMAEFQQWKEQASRPEPEPDDSTNRQPAMAT